jgi:hypothetical protein
MLILHDCGFLVLGSQARDGPEAAAEEGVVELRDLFFVLDHTENVEGGELRAFKDDLVVPVDGVEEDETEGDNVRVFRPYGTGE